MKTAAKKTNPAANAAARPPVVVVLGHIDHGKSSLLEAIREDFRITAKESGGITQHIGAYQITLPNGKKITFLDTPGHEAFFQMRSRGAKVADIAILVIDATEGVKAQTKEAISHIKKAGLPLIVALNKVDKPDAISEKVKRELSQEGILVESFGGKVLSIDISAKTGKGVTELVDLISLVAEMEELKAETEKPTAGVVIESYLDNLRGPTATLLLTQGTLKAGDIIATVSAFTKIKSLEDFRKSFLKKAFPGDPVIIFGFNQVPKTGEEFKVFPDMESAQKNIGAEGGRQPEVLEISEGQKVLNLILKTDVAGSLEAIEEILKSLPQEKVVLRILKSEVGSINESDVSLAKSGRALILGFRVKTETSAKSVLERENVKVMNFEVIYDLVEGTRKFMERILEPEEVRQDLGKVRILGVFLTEKNRQIIGGRVTEGEMRKGALIEVFRRDEKVGQGKLVNLQRNKKEAQSVSKGEECGMFFEGDVKIEEGDILQAYLESRVKTNL